LFFVIYSAKYKAANNPGLALDETQLGRCQLKILNTPRSKIGSNKGKYCTGNKGARLYYDFEITALPNSQKLL